MVRKRINIVFFALLLISACNSSEKSVDEHKITVKSNNSSTQAKNSQKDTLKLVTDTLGEKFKQAGLVDVQTLNPNIYVMLKYASEDNFMHENVYGSLAKAYLQPEMAKKVAKAQEKLTTIDSNLHLLIYDATRPRSVQQKMWNLLDSIPIHQRVKFVSNPKNGSIHNYGWAVDLTICDENKVPLDMGAGYDDARKIAYPILEEKFLASGELSQQQVKNRKLLRKVMRAGGMWNIQTEWWHFNGMTRTKAKENYNIIE